MIEFKDITYGEDSHNLIQLYRSNDVMYNYIRVNIKQYISNDYIDWCRHMNHPIPMKYDIFERTQTPCKHGDYLTHSFRLNKQNALKVIWYLIKYLFRR